MKGSYGYISRTQWYKHVKTEKNSSYIFIACLILVAAISFSPIISASNPSSADSDNDGLPDGWENQYMLNPGDPSDAYQDYNHDGLIVLEEYKRGFDPFNRDTDNDKISNYAEVTGLFGVVTDPLNADTDGDGLTDLEELAPLYVSVSNQTQMDELFVDASLIQSLRDKYYPYRLSPINPDVDGDGILDGEEMTRGTSPTNVDSDSDGLTDFEEAYRYSTNPANIDTDGDWLADREELTGGSYGIITDPNNPDTDGDGISDGEELLPFALVRIYPSENALTYEQFIADNSYAGEYVTIKARVADIIHEPQDNMKSYTIKLKTINTVAGNYLFSIGPSFKPELEKREISEGLKAAFADNSHPLSDTAKLSVLTKGVWKIKNGREAYQIRESRQDNKLYVYIGDLGARRGIVHVGNSWHYDLEHDANFVDDVFGYILKKNDAIVVTGVAGKFVGMTRDITVKTNSNDSEGSIYVLLDPAEAALRASTQDSASPTTAYPFWSHVKLVSVPTNYPSWPYVNLTPARKASTTSAANNTTIEVSNTEIQDLTEEVTLLRREIGYLKKQLNSVSESVVASKSEVTPEPKAVNATNATTAATVANEPKFGINNPLLGLLDKRVIGVVVVGVSIVVCVKYIRRSRQGEKKEKKKRKQKGKEQKEPEGGNVDILPTLSRQTGTSKVWR